ncbi:hypothetical protein GGI21_001626 [Coemansia aciculifera]|nr:hypothetical protein GGI21_001626 [Coemansia aciculifera]
MNLPDSVPPYNNIFELHLCCSNGHEWDVYDLEIEGKLSVNKLRSIVMDISHNNIGGTMGADLYEGSIEDGCDVRLTDEHFDSVEWWLNSFNKETNMYKLYAKLKPASHL